MLSVNGTVELVATPDPALAPPPPPPPPPPQLANDKIIAAGAAIARNDRNICTPSLIKPPTSTEKLRTAHARNTLL
jgi:hypothetical protein